MEEAIAPVESTPAPSPEPEKLASFSRVAEHMVDIFDKKEIPNHEPKITVNRFVSEIANWYEKLRNAMDYRDEEVVLRASIERILKRRLGVSITGSKHHKEGSGQKIAEPLLKELVWAHYFPNGSLPESYTRHCAEIIDLWIRWRKGVKARFVMRDNVLDLWFYQLLSSHLARFLNPQIFRNTMSNFMFYVMKDEVQITDDTEETKQVQVYLAVRRAYCKDDTAFIRFALFEQIFGRLSQHNVEGAIGGFKSGYQEIKKQMNYKLKEKIYQQVKKQTPVFLILEDVLSHHKGKLRQAYTNEEEFKKAVFDACQKRYNSIRKRVAFAIVKSVVFLLVTKAIFALLIEGTYDKYVYGNIGWLSIFLNIAIPPLLLIIVSLFITQPHDDNSQRILDKIHIVLMEEDPKITPRFVVAKKPKKKPMHYIFIAIWLFAFFLSFGTMANVLSALHFNLVSELVFMFFIAIVSFLAYGISSTAHQYTVDPKPGLFTPFIDFLFIPIVRVGRWFTDGISSINFIVFIFDYVIEIPFKAIFGFFDQLFWYLHTKREELE